MKRRIRKELLNELLSGYEKSDDLTGPEGLLEQLTGALVERALAAELTEYLGHEPGAPAVHGNSRNGTSPKTPTTEQGEVPIEVPRDRNGTFEDRLVRQHQRRFPGFDDKIVSMYAPGMSVRDIQAHLSEIYGTEISPSLISTVTDAVVDEVAKWQARPLDPIWPIVYLDAIVLKLPGDRCLIHVGREVSRTLASAPLLSAMVHFSGECPRIPRKCPSFQALTLAHSG
ncbi:MAG: hypothetical protein A2V88_13070 [Elusimicrobia bacterium RBG_16_66_12]|nr:MAG: hypothetical protein A2V88_13070 [Elusimicrobia bacterium RBG_16_66_12]